MQISDKHVVLIHYTLTNDAGEVLDQSDENSPLVYLHGAGNIIPGLEKELLGRTTGDSFRAVIPAAEAYGERHEALQQSVPKEAFGGVEVQVGMRFQAETDQGQVPVMITAVEGDTVTVDGNHPLAGQQLTFDVEVAGVRQANEEELSHGHPHGPMGNENH